VRGFQGFSLVVVIAWIHCYCCKALGGTRVVIGKGSMLMLLRYHYGGGDGDGDGDHVGVECSRFALRGSKIGWIQRIIPMNQLDTGVSDCLSTPFVLTVSTSLCVLCIQCSDKQKPSAKNDTIIRLSSHNHIRLRLHNRIHLISHKHTQLISHNHIHLISQSYASHLTPSFTLPLCHGLGYLH